MRALQLFSVFQTALLLSLTGAQVGADLYVSGFSSGGVYRFQEGTGGPVGSGMFIAPGTAGLSQPHGILMLADRTLLVASAGTDEVLRFHSDGSFHSKFIANGVNGLPPGTLDYPVDLAVNPAGDLFVSSQLNDRILRFNPQTGAFLGVFAQLDAGSAPSGIQWNAAGSALYVSHRNGMTVSKWNSQGVQDPSFDPDPFQQPFGLALHPVNGRVFVADGSLNQIRGMDPGTGLTLSTAPSTFPVGVRFGPGEDLSVAVFGENRIARLDPFSGAAKPDLVSAAAANAAGLQGPNFFLVVPDALSLWRQQFFNTTSNSGAAADLSDPDQDSLPNLLEYAVGTNPTQAGPVPGTFSTENGFLTLTVSKATDAGIQWGAESSGALAGWSQAGVTVLENTPQTFKVRDNFPQDGRRFLRLKISRP